MRFSVLVSEAWRNLSNSSARTLSVVIATLATSLGLALTAFLQTQMYVQQASAFQASGATTILTEATGAVDGRVCDELSNSGVVAAAGALRRASSVSPAALPELSIPVFEATPGMDRVLGTYEGVPGILISNQVAEMLGVRPGGKLALGNGTELPIGEVYDFPEDGRTSALAFAIVAPVASSQRFDVCWTRVWPSTSLTRSLGRAAVLSSGTEEPKQSQLNTTRGLEFDGYDSFAHRVTRWAPQVLAGAMVALFGVSIYSRRLVVASDLHAGLRRTDALAIFLIEGIVLILPATLGVGLFGLGISSIVDPLNGPAVFGEQIEILAGAVVGMMVGTVVGVLCIRPSRIFDYFRTR